MLSFHHGSNTSSRNSLKQTASTELWDGDARGCRLTRGKERLRERNRGREGGGEGMVRVDREGKRGDRKGGRRERAGKHPGRASCKLSVEWLLCEDPEVSV